MAKAIIFDCETTGFNFPEIIEAAWIEVNEPYDLCPNGEYDQFFRPTKPIEIGAVATHNIIELDLIDAPPVSEFRLPDGLKYMIGHNIDFDWEAAGKPDVKRICTLALSRFLWPNLDAHKQTAMMYYLFGKNDEVRSKVKNAHNALCDVRNCSEVLERIIGELISRGYVVSTWDNLWSISEMARVPTRMPVGKYKGELIKDLPASYVSWFLKQPDVDPYLLKALKAY